MSVLTGTEFVTLCSRFLSSLCNHLQQLCSLLMEFHRIYVEYIIRLTYARCFYHESINVSIILNPVPDSYSFIIERQQRNELSLFVLITSLYFTELIPRN
jgi:hypothetical protein